MIGEDAAALRHMDEAARDDGRRPLALDGGAVEADGAAARRA